MSASALSFSDWQQSVMAELRDRISDLAAVVVDLDPSSPMHRCVAACKAAWLAGDVVEVERLLSAAVEFLERQVEQQETALEWRAAEIIRARWATR
jgi:hypothetical protein